MTLGGHLMSRPMNWVVPLFSSGFFVTIYLLLQIIHNIYRK